MYLSAPFSLVFLGSPSCRILYKALFQEISFPFHTYLVVSGPYMAPYTESYTWLQCFPMFYNKFSESATIGDSTHWLCLWQCGSSKIIVVVALCCWSSCTVGELSFVFVGLFFNSICIATCIQCTWVFPPIWRFDWHAFMCSRVTTQWCPQEISEAQLGRAHVQAWLLYNENYIGNTSTTIQGMTIITSIKNQLNKL